MKMHLNFATRDLDASVAFYAALLGAEPAKVVADYALFITEQPALELALDLDPDAVGAPGHHFGVAVESLRDVERQSERLAAAGYAIELEREETCCYANQTKVWTADPEGRRWETYFVHEETEDRDRAEMSCCK